MKEKASGFVRRGWIEVHRVLAANIIWKTASHQFGVDSGHRSRSLQKHARMFLLTLAGKWRRIKKLDCRVCCKVWSKSHGGIKGSSAPDPLLGHKVSPFMIYLFSYTTFFWTEYLWTTQPCPSSLRTVCCFSFLKQLGAGLLIAGSLRKRFDFTLHLGAPSFDSTLRMFSSRREAWSTEEKISGSKSFWTLETVCFSLFFCTVLVAANPISRVFSNKSMLLRSTLQQFVGIVRAILFHSN